MVAFILSNALAAASPSYPFLFVARIFMAASCALIVILATRFATELVSPARRGRAIGIIFMGVSGSIVLGVPIGMEIDYVYGWRIIFVIVAIVTLPLIALLGWLLPRGHGARSIAHAETWRQYLTQKLILGQLVSVTMIGGHFTLFAYLAPYILETYDLDRNSLQWAFVCFGVAGVTGAYLGGWCSDRFGRDRALVLCPTLYLSAYIFIWYVRESTPWFIAALVMWGCLSWTISPVVQAFLIDASSENAERSVGINAAAMHFGVAAGDELGGVVLHWGGIAMLPFAGSALTALATGLAYLATNLKVSRNKEAVESL
jgi:DHA1 family purine base/nucleoside efflux pump-like MFS transporter